MDVTLVKLLTLFPTNVSWPNSNITKLIIEYVCAWIQSWLTQHTQSVVANGASSQPVAIYFIKILLLISHDGA